jgi:hypothetical protein
LDSSALDARAQIAPQYVAKRRQVVVFSTMPPLTVLLCGYVQTPKVLSS